MKIDTNKMPASQQRSNAKFNYLALDLIDIKSDYNNMMEIYSFLEGIINKKLKAKEIHKPVLIPYYHGKVKSDCGISCYAFFEGGYVTFHVFEKRNLAYFDIVSRDAIDSKKITGYVQKLLEAKSVNVYTETTENKVLTKDVFGPHFFASGSLYKEMNISDLLVVQEQIINKIGMTPIITPTIVKDGQDVRAFIAIAESHICLKLSGKQLKVDIFSCEQFSIEKLKEVLSSVMELKEEILFTRHCKKNSKE